MSTESRIALSHLESIVQSNEKLLTSMNCIYTVIGKTNSIIETGVNAISLIGTAALAFCGWYILRNNNNNNNNNNGINPVEQFLKQHIISTTCYKPWIEKFHYSCKKLFIEVLLNPLPLKPLKPWILGSVSVAVSAKVFFAWLRSTFEVGPAVGFMILRFTNAAWPFAMDDMFHFYPSTENCMCYNSENCNYNMCVYGTIASIATCLLITWIGKKIFKKCNTVLLYSACLFTTMSFPLVLSLCSWFIAVPDTYLGVKIELTLFRLFFASLPWSWFVFREFSM